MKHKKEWSWRKIFAVFGFIVCVVWFILAVELLPASFTPPYRWGDGVDSAKLFITLADGTHWDSTAGAARTECARYDSTITGLSNDTGYIVICRIWDADSGKDWTFYWPLISSATATGSYTYTIDIYAFDTLGGTTTAVEGANVDFRLWSLGQPSHRTVTTGASGAGRIATDVGSLAVRIEHNPFYIFPTVWDSLKWTTDSSDSIYGYLNVPAAATSPNYVLAYIDIGEGIIDSASGSMIPRTAIQLYLELIGHTTLNDGSWMIVPKRQVKSPDANGRVNFIIPANTVLTPEGSYYILSFRAYDGTQQITGELKRFIVDTIPDPILILDATETW